MKCPKCNNDTLAEMGTSEGVTLDFCHSCSGMLFDHGELAEYFELAADIPDLATDIKNARRTGLVCPKCGGPWVEIPYTPHDNLMVDLCTRCGAVWLDKGEFPKLEAMTAKLDRPASKLLRAVKAVETKGFVVIGWKQG